MQGTAGMEGHAIHISQAVQGLTDEKRDNPGGYIRPPTGVWDRKRKGQNSSRNRHYSCRSIRDRCPASCGRRFLVASTNSELLISNPRATDHALTSRGSRTVF